MRGEIMQEIQKEVEDAVEQCHRKNTALKQADFIREEISFPVGSDDASREQFVVREDGAADWSGDVVPFQDKLYEIVTDATIAFWRSSQETTIWRPWVLALRKAAASIAVCSTQPAILGRKPF